MRSTRDKNWKWCFGDGDRGDPGDRQAGEGGPLYQEETKDETRIDIPGKGQGVKEVAPDSELTSVSAIVGHVLIS